MATAPTSPAPEPLSMGAVLRIPAMRRLWYAQIVSTFGDFLALFAVIGIMTFKLAATPQQVIGVQIAYLVPIAILGIVAGVFVDRWPLKPTMVASDLIRAALVLLLLFATRVSHYYAVLAAISVVSSFFGPAQGVALRSIVPFHGLRSANALMQQVMFVMRIAGPFVAAMLVSAFGAKSCYYADAVSFVASGCLIASVAFGKLTAPVTPATPAAASEATGVTRIWLDMKQGFDFIIHHAALLFTLLALSSGMFVLGCFGPLIAVYVRDSLHASTRTFGFASSAIGIGMLCGINGLTVFARKVKNTYLVYAGLSGIAAGLVLLTLVTRFWTTIAGDFAIGLSVSGIIIPAQTLIQQETPPPLMGRVGSTVMSFIFGAQILGLIVSSVLAERIGVRHVFAVCAALLAVLVVVGRLWMEPRESA
ncbi:MFS transporter [Granulicella sibirica]|uniref:Major facilitator superfamily (MFS) transporter n=1 Tax=Granulicella sibirica TaxID=2479048 RepID=A0A4Q0T289_9BACT|nr:MFS transporter [Granulicella sibirica]RXH57713.1 major facilitator superfamily (MFS) transporter [Granulicella sibirica]